MFEGFGRFLKTAHTFVTGGMAAVKSSGKPLSPSEIEESAYERAKADRREAKFKPSELAAAYLSVFSLPPEPERDLRHADRLNEKQLGNYVGARFWAGMQGVLSNRSAEGCKAIVDQGYFRLIERFEASSRDEMHTVFAKIGDTCHQIRGKMDNPEDWPLGVAAWSIGHTNDAQLLNALAIELLVHYLSCRGYARACLE